MAIIEVPVERKKQDNLTIATVSGSYSGTGHYNGPHREEVYHNIGEDTYIYRYDVYYPTGDDFTSDGYDVTFTANAGAAYNNVRVWGTKGKSVVNTYGTDDAIYGGNNQYNPQPMGTYYIDAGGGRNEVRISSAQSANIDTGNGDDTVSVLHSKNGNIDVGDGKNNVRVYSNPEDASKVKITSGINEDDIEVNYTSAEINSGAGDDTIRNFDDYDQYAAAMGDGNFDLKADRSSIINSGEGKDLIFN